MAKTLPGTTIAVDWNRPEEAETLLNSLFLAGGLMLSQVASLTGLEPYVIQNWVRRGFVAPPERNVTLNIHKQTITALSFIGVNLKLHFTSPCSHRQKSRSFQ